MSRLKIISPGFLSTVQDRGRYGYRSYGMPLSGAMDFFSHMTGNLLVGNAPGEASLEFTLTGPEIEFTGKAVVAVTGAEMDPKINGEPVAMWQSHRVGRNDRLTFSYPGSGARSYLAVAGGIRLREVMGSRSTYIRGKTGGHEGRKLDAGDSIEVRGAMQGYRKMRRLPVNLIPEWRSCQSLMVLPGIDVSAFTDETLMLFHNSQFGVTNNSDRMGIRLSGPSVFHKGKADVISYPLHPGVIQVPGDGNPVIMLADSQTVGGYTQIAVIATADLFMTGQLKPGDSVKFKAAEYKDACTKLDELMGELDQVFGKPGRRVTMENYRNL